MKTLYIGIHTPGTTSRSRAEALGRVVGADGLSVIDTDEPFWSATRASRSLAFRLRIGPVVDGINRQVARALTRRVDTFDLVWIDKAVYLWPKTMDRLRSRTGRLVHYTPDAAFYANRSRFFERSMNVFDRLVTTKRFEMDQYTRHVDRRRVQCVSQSFDATRFANWNPPASNRPEAAMVGLCEPDRERCVDTLLNLGVDVCVGGKGWDALVDRHRGNARLRYVGSNVFGHDYCDTIGGASVGLGLLTRRFPERHTTRTFEIPALGTVLATERNDETSRFFNDDEAIFFDPDDYEMLGRRIGDLLKDPSRLNAMAERGRRRVLRDGRDNDSMIRSVLHDLGVPTDRHADRDQQ